MSWPKRLKQVIVKRRVNDNSYDYVDDDNIDHRNNNTVALLPRLPTLQESHP